MYGSVGAESETNGQRSLPVGERFKGMEWKYDEDLCVWTNETEIHVFF